MGRCSRSVIGLACFLSLCVPGMLLQGAIAAIDDEKTAVPPASESSEPVEISADRTTYDKETEVLEADGSVVIVQGPVRLTADHATLEMLTGNVTATGQVYLVRQTSELWAERLQLNLNTEMGVFTNGRLFTKETNTTVIARQLQRFSEDHYRAKEGSFTNCDVMEGETPAWRFKFEDVDLEQGDSIYLKKVWFCVNDVPVIPFPTFRYPLVERKTGFLIPTIGYDNQFGFKYRQGFFLDINPSHDVTISPFLLTERGYGGDMEYHYALSRRAKGEWLGFFIQDTEIDRARGAVRGFHTHQFNPDLSLRVNANLITDRDLLNDLANSGALRAVPSLESNFDLNQRLDHGQLYLRAQYLQPVGEGGATTFQRLPEIGHRLVGVRPGDGPAQLGMESTVLYWYREEGFDLGRADLMPTFETDTLSLGHVVGIIPQARLRGVFYTRGTTTTDAVDRGTFWIGPRAISRLTRRFSLEGERSLVHTIEPDVIYEYVPATDQSDIVQVDAVDDLPRKNLLTYLVSTRLIEQGRGTSSTWLDLRVGQSYNLGNRQPPAPKLSDLWVKAVVGNVAPTGGSVSLALDTFFDTGSGEFSQWNTDFRYQQDSIWYVELSQRFARKGDRVRRGDIWNPLSFGEVLTATEDLKFLTSTGAIRLPLGFTVGAKSYYNFETQQSEELDVVGLYQNPCRCWSLGVYYIEFPDRTQVNFMVSLTGLGSTAGLGARLFQAILGPLFGQERGVPWAIR